MDDITFEVLLYTITFNIVNKLLDEFNWNEDEALERFINSEVYSYLEDEKSKFWQYSIILLVELFKDELQGRLVLPEV